MQRITTLLPYERFKILSYIVVSLPFALALAGTVLDVVVPDAPLEMQHSIAYRVQSSLLELLFLMLTPTLLVINRLFPAEGLAAIINSLMAFVCTIIWLNMVPFLIARVVYKRTLAGVLGVTMTWLVIIILLIGLS